MSPWPDTPLASADVPGALELSAQDRRQLLGIARASIEARLSGVTFTPAAVSALLAAPSGVFVTLRNSQTLRGCIGFPFACDPLYRAVSDASVGAAFQDPRFPPVTPRELEELTISISVLSPLFTVTPDQIELGVHGLMVTLGPARGLMLPQVAVEHGWTVFEFLENTCAKAGLAREEWKAAQVDAFTAQTFSDDGQQA